MTALELTFPRIDPVAFRLGPLQVHWYALMYLLAFALGYALMLRRLHHQPYARILPAWTRHEIEDMLLGSVAGVILGGRLGYCLFYKPAYYAANPLDIFKVWEGGMSFHGGAIGVVVALLLHGWRKHRPFLEVTDLLVPAVPIGLAAGRLGNFINGELWGREAPASLPWAMVFPGAGPELRHPSQLYQMLGEGLLLFVLLWLYARRERSRGQVSGAFVLGYGLLRFGAEYFREPDDYLGLLSLGLSMGQWLCVPMIIGGAALWVWARARGARPPLEPVVVTPDADETERKSDEPKKDEADADTTEPEPADEDPEEKADPEKTADDQTADDRTADNKDEPEGGATAAGPGRA